MTEITNIASFKSTLEAGGFAIVPAYLFEDIKAECVKHGVDTTHLYSDAETDFKKVTDGTGCYGVAETEGGHRLIKLCNHGK